VLWRADADRAEARASLKRDPTNAIEAANRSIALNPERVDTYVVKAAAYARTGDYAAARRVLLIAVHKEPHNYVPWALLGDLAMRRRLPDQARRNYQRASRLNPSDRDLAKLPRLVVGRDGS
jgi:cytochrome c-type biogenesis protein CcmH/NrfG